MKEGVNEGNFVGKRLYSVRERERGGRERGGEREREGERERREGGREGERGKGRRREKVLKH